MNTYGMNMERMGWLMEICKGIPLDHFDMGSIFRGKRIEGSSFVGKIAESTNLFANNRNICQTTACLAGWCGTDPRFNKLKVKLDVKVNKNGVVHDNMSVSALDTALGINWDARQLLFFEWDYETGQEAKDERIERIQEVMDNPQIYGVDVWPSS